MVFIWNMPAPNAVLMNTSMAKMNGNATTREICKSAQFRTPPILALAAREINGDREKRLDIGADGCIAKPVYTDQILSLMRV